MAAKKKAAKKAAKATKSAKATSGGGIIKEGYSYQTHAEVKTASGRKAVDNADPVADALRGMSRDEVFEVCKANEVEVQPRWKVMNPGLGRMAAGNALRGMYRRDGKIKVGSRYVRNPKHESNKEKEAA